MPHEARKPKVLIVATHPIQYQVPWFVALEQSGRIDLTVLYVRIPDAAAQGVGFGVAFQWDIPLLDGYRWMQAPDVASRGRLGGFFSSRLRRVADLLRTVGPDVVVLTGWQTWALWQLLATARRLGIPVVMRGESNALRRRPGPVRLLHRLLLGQCQAFLPIGLANRAFYEEYGIAPGRMFGTPYFVDNRRFADAAGALLPQRASLRARWGIPEHAMCFLYAGKLQPKKRILDLLGALAACVPQSPPIHLLVVGTGELMAQAETAVRAGRLPVTFAGFLNQTEMPAAYAAADCLVLPSDAGETWGLVVNEAMACGRPAIVSDLVGCARDLVTDGETGFVFPCGDVPALAAAMLRVAGDPASTGAMGARARARVLAGYSVQGAVEGTLAAVAAVTGNAPAARP